MPWRLLISDATSQSERRFKPDTLASSIIILLAVNVVQRSIGFGRGVLFCRWLEPEALGHWEMAFSFLLLAAPVAVLGLPGSFGRYLAKYRDQGQVRLFLRRTATWTASFGLAAIGFVVIKREFFARLVFGESAATHLLLVTAGTLAVVIGHHFLEAVFSGLKLFRVVSAMHFCQSVVFAAAALTLVVVWRADAVSLVAGYGIGCGVSILGTLVWSLMLGFGDMSAQNERMSHREFWPPLMRFALGLWVANILCNLFSIIDRYMILHVGSFEPAMAMELIGNYHTANIVPVLLISVGNLLAGALTPHLSHDWEKGDQQRVSQRLNTALQLVAAAMLAAGSGVLLFCPWLFELAFDAKYAAGLAVLPWTVAACVWFALLLIAQTYAWCAEQTRATAAPLAIGLVLNIWLNLVWLPLWGLAGAVAATAVSTALALYAQLAVNQRLGMQPSPVTLGACLCPALLICGVTTALVGIAVIALGVAFVAFTNRSPGAFAFAAPKSIQN